MDAYTRPADATLSRRAVMRNAGLAAAALAGLSGCTNYGAPAAPSTDVSSTTSGPTSGANGATAKTADIPVGGGKIFPDVQAVITQPTAGEFKAFTSICTHQQCPVAEVTDTINCNCHGSKFSITDGSVVNPPAPQPLAAKTVTVNGDNLTVA
jgi:nitrite reductase/ring-hydroxylating ferredoxin subunit